MCVCVSERRLHSVSSSFIIYYLYRGTFKDESIQCSCERFISELIFYYLLPVYSIGTFKDESIQCSCYCSAPNRVSFAQ